MVVSNHPRQRSAFHTLRENRLFYALCRSQTLPATLIVIDNANIFSPSRVT